MLKIVLSYAVLLALLLTGMKLLEEFYVFRTLSFELYAGIIAGVFTVVGVVAGLRFTTTTTSTTDRNTSAEAVMSAQDSGLSGRELEVLQLIQAGLSNRQIAEKLFISENTVKSHLSSIYGKLDAQRRTEAVIKAQSIGVLT